MFPCEIKMSVTSLMFLFLLTFAYAEERILEARLNPGCAQCGARAVALRAAARGARDSLQALWALGAAPALLAARAPPAATLALRWWRAAPAHFAFSERPYYGYGLVVDSLYEYNDVNDVGKFDPSMQHKITPLSDFSWDLVNSTLTEKEAMVLIRGKLHHHGNSRRDDNGYIDVKMDLLPFTGEGRELPHLMHSSNSTRVDISLVNLTTFRHYNSSRFALKLIFISTDNETDSWNCTIRKNLDDTQAPGVFEMIDIRSPLEVSSNMGAFVQAFPVAYTDPERTVSSSTDAHISAFNRSELPNSGWVKQYYQDYPLDGALLVQEALVSLGGAGDGFYRARRYATWSLMIGSGEPPTDRMSILVYITIVLVSGVIITLILVAIAFSIYYLIKKCRQRSTHNYLLF